MPVGDSKELREAEGGMFDALWARGRGLSVESMSDSALDTILSSLTSETIESSKESSPSSSRVEQISSRSRFKEKNKADPVGEAARSLKSHREADSSQSSSADRSTDGLYKTVANSLEALSGRVAEASQNSITSQKISRETATEVKGIGEILARLAISVENLESSYKSNMSHLAGQISRLDHRCSTLEKLLRALVSSSRFEGTQISRAARAADVVREAALHTTHLSQSDVLGDAQDSEFEPDDLPLEDSDNTPTASRASGSDRSRMDLEAIAEHLDLVPLTSARKSESVKTLLGSVPW